MIIKLFLGKEHNNTYLGVEAGSGQTIISYNSLYKYANTHENEKIEKSTFLL